MRTTDKHGPRVDDAMRKDTEAIERGAPSGTRVEGHRVDEEVPRVIKAGRSGDREANAGMTEDEIEKRSQIAQALDPSIFPADRPELLRSAQEHDAPQWVVDLLSNLPPMQRYENVQDIWTTLGGATEHRG